MSNFNNFFPHKRYLFFISQDYSFPVLRPLQDAILKRGDVVKWFMYGDEIHKESVTKHEQLLNSVEEILAFNPQAVFVPGNVVPSFIPGLKIQVFHGLPSTKARKNGQLYHFIIRGMFDLYCTHGESSTKPFKLLAKKHKFFTVKETGWCKLDPLFPLAKKSPSSTSKNIFFASTFSPRFSKARVLYPFIMEMIQKYDYTWYITLHPKMDVSIVKLYKSIDAQNVHFVETVDTIESFKKSNLMLCDTSSIIYEYLTQHKPVITFQTQKEEDTLINVSTLDELETTLVNTLDNLDTHSQTIKTNVDLFHPYTDGKSSQRVLDVAEEMLEGKYLATKKKPLNILRNLKLRKILNYWKFNF
jgi:CDP-glycerol glycerophosphotransferase (TagB/SpsB family)